MNTLEDGFTVYGLTLKQIAELRDFWLRHHNHLPCEPLTFELIRKNCVAGETLLIDQYDSVRLFLGFNRRGYLITDHRGGSSCSQYTQDKIKDWKIGGKYDRSRD